MKLSIAAAALASIVSVSGPAVTPVPLVSASGATESTVAVALVNVHAPVTMARAANALLDDTNRERASRGLAPLVRDAALDRFAAAKAADMAARGYFGHTSPEGVTFADRMRAGSWPTEYVAENIAFDVSEPAAHHAFVNSPPHLSNLVDANEIRIGVAVVNVGTHETFFVEDFSK